MNLLEIYKEKNKDADWFNSHFSLSNGSFGRMFEYTNTNFRYQKTFINDFEKFIEIENKPRNTWPKQSNHGQEEHKHYVVNMLQSKLFKKDVNGIFSRTSKGILYTDFIRLDMPENDRFFLNYLFLINGYFLNRKNYILNRVKEDLTISLLSAEGITKDLLINESKKLIKLTSIKEAIRSDFFYFHSFYSDQEFLTCYIRSNQEEKNELYSYIEKNLEDKNYQCCISKKYQPGGNFNFPQLLDETKVFLITFLFTEEKHIGLENINKTFFNIFIKNIGRIENSSLVYLNLNKSIFDPIFEDIIEIDTTETLDKNQVEDMFEKVSISDSSQIYKTEEKDIPEDYIDETNEEGRLKIKAIFNIRKRQARILSEYKCALENINECHHGYFTAKASGKNYLELHHFVPQEFRNDFSYSIEVLANYVTLCPRCHKQIHLAVDGERKPLINYLFNSRKDRLKIVGLELKLEDIYKYYKIETK